jgi:hypothetical protein
MVEGGRGRFGAGDELVDKLRIKRHPKRLIGAVGLWFVFDVQNLARTQSNAFARPNTELTSVMSQVFRARDDVNDDGGTGRNRMERQFPRLKDRGGGAYACSGNNLAIQKVTLNRLPRRQTGAAILFAVSGYPWP